MSAENEIPVALTIAGFDGSGGAGVLADCRTFERLGVYGTGVITGVVAQSPGTIAGIEVTSPGMFQAQLDEIISSYPVKAAKTGALLSLSEIEIAVVFFRENPEISLVIDPVLIATAGDQLGHREIDWLFPAAELITPNICEAETLLTGKIETMADMESAALKFYESYGCACLLKGGHLDCCTEDMVDILCENGEIEILASPRLEIPELHGTGCTLSAAITAGLAQGLSLRESVIQARAKMHEWMKNFHAWSQPAVTHALNAIDE
ncbi:MAG: hydroxymethylpyrimidine/phosphomethylpyrimidine kinase [Verrucomicrobiales bacterium]|nr:hydroxymethylpyrimidine/phosphomethylpyrimidine kinase [Verrucomicrobiales bacterium]